MSFLFSSKLVLASSSPRRQQLLQLMNVQFEIVAPNIEEDYPFQLQPAKVPEYLAMAKAQHVLKTTQTTDIVLAADTLVFLDKKIIGKPSHREDAIEILERLSGKVHSVITGVAICKQNFSTHFFCETLVEFYPLLRDEIVYYVDTYKPLDKAGAYSISEWLGLYGIKRIEGDYYNVLGLPISETMRRLVAIG